jgi:hypothetical protein
MATVRYGRSTRKPKWMCSTRPSEVSLPSDDAHLHLCRARSERSYYWFIEGEPMPTISIDTPPFARYVLMAASVKWEPDTINRRPLGRDTDERRPTREIVWPIMADGKVHSISEIHRQHKNYPKDTIKGELISGCHKGIYDRDHKGGYWLTARTRHA